MTIRAFAVLAVAALATIGSAAAGASSTDWNTALPTAAAEQRNLYFEARYRDASGVEHRQQVWREGSKRLRRRTDDRLDLAVEKDADGEYQYRLADRAKNMLILADRTSLYRVGIFSDWRGLAHVLSEPRAPHEVVAERGDVEQTGAGPCSWVELTVQSPSPAISRVCWSREWGVPLSIQAKQDGAWITQFAIEEVRTFEPSDATFQIEQAGFVEIDARASEDVSD
ncbi:MAG: hypothetical protein NVSMB26_29200 [Beijerinckiaceae bacterium]